MHYFYSKGYDSEISYSKRHDSEINSFISPRNTDCFSYLGEISPAPIK